MGSLGVAAMMSVIGVIIFMRRKKKLEKLNSEDMELSGEKGTSEKVAETPSPKAASLLPLPSGWEITYSELEIGSELGRGGFNSFNCSHLPQCRELFTKENGEEQLVNPNYIKSLLVVAVKCMITESLSETDISSFQKEIKVMKHVRPHPNVVLVTTPFPCD